MFNSLLTFNDNTIIFFSCFDFLFGGPSAMANHSHEFVERYTGLVGFGLDRGTDESTLICYIQKFSDDAVMAAIIKRLEDRELADLFDGINRLLRRHFTEAEYHRLFLKDEDHEDVR